MGQFLTLEEKFERKLHEAGWFHLTPLEQLAVEFIEDLKKDLSCAIDNRDEYRHEADSLQDRINDLDYEVQRLEQENEDLQDRDDTEHVEELEREVEFLQSLVDDMENELAVIDADPQPAVVVAGGGTSCLAGHGQGGAANIITRNI